MNKEYMQKITDRRVELEIKIRANELYASWLLAPVIDGEKCWLKDSTKGAFLYEIHDHNSAKYLNTDLSRLVDEKFEQLKQEYEEK